MPGGSGKAHKGGAVKNQRGTGRFIATQDLTPQQAAFVRELVANGGNGTRAAEAAGYSYPGQAAYDLKRLPHVQAAIRAERERLIGGELANKAIAVLKEIMDDRDNAPAAVRRLAARDILEMAGHIGPGAKPAVPDDDKPLAEMTPEELQRFIEAETKALEELRRAVPETIEGEARPVDPAPIAPGKTPGLSDVDPESGEIIALSGGGAPPT